METNNQTSLEEFIILGFSDYPRIKYLIFGMLLMIYLITLIGNLLIITVTSIDVHLQNPMYFFLSNLSCIDICYTSVTLNKILSIFITKNATISFVACIMQLYLFMSLAGTEFSILAVMAYDRYVAICNPLRYSMIMKKRICGLLAAASWILGFLEIIPHTVLTSQLSFCGSNIINHFFCDLTALLKLSCSDTFVIETVILLEGLLLGLSPFLLTLSSYVFIISAILKINSTESRRKLFSTCSSHLTVVILFYGSAICMYLRPASMYSMGKDKLFAVLYIAVIPMLNPIIYTLRNKDVKSALLKVISRK
ncbi:olfactory receptor 5V1-like [Rhinatrema bivittatum]|uniref:olfactory receptor 5V1-like n=1 Tax=Rhinatrema bivittatum TaxID=194408 RepID=UPI0011273D66|nr:olfactory receptor 5V1-like [Rhinatrema bivittatum]